MGASTKFDLMRLLQRVFQGLLALALAGCVASESDQGHGLGLQVMTLTESGPQRGLPPEADTIRFLVLDDDANVIRDYSRSVVGLEDLDGDGPSDREAVVQIPPDTPVSITVFASKNIQTLATARIDDVEVENGGRRFVSLTFTPVKSVSKLPFALPSGRFGHAASRIEGDGRILVTGGFTSASPVACPPSLAGAEACFQLQATNEAFLIDPADGAVYPTRTPMLRPRALHTSTAMGDGRVLVAGGLDAAIMGLVRIEGSMGHFELQPRFVPASDAIEATARSFELFDPAQMREEEDLDHNGDPQAGAFVGSPGVPSTPGAMNTSRFLHAAALLPDTDEGVLIVGGQGSAEAPYTGEVFLARRPGGSGFLFPPVPMSDMSNPRVWPAATTADGFVYVIGGAYPPTTSQQLIERWVPGPEVGSGSFQNLTTCEGWSPSDRPNYALVGARSTVIGRDPRRVVAVGWAGPLCSEPAEGQPAINHSYDGTAACAPEVYERSPFTVGIEQCTFGPLGDPAAPHFLGAVTPMPSGRGLIAGGFSDGRLNATATVEILTGEFVGAANLARRQDATYNMERGRAWHTGTMLYGGRVALIGGMSFTYNAGPDTPDGIDLSPTVEIYDPGWDPSAQITGDGD